MSEVYTIEDWVNDYSASANVSKKLAREQLDLAVSLLVTGVQNKRKARIPGFGILRVLTRKAYTAINPSILAKEGIKKTVEVPAKGYVKFDAATSFTV